MGNYRDVATRGTFLLSFHPLTHRRSFIYFVFASLRAAACFANVYASKRLFFAARSTVMSLPPCLAWCVSLSLLRIALFFSSEIDASRRELSNAGSGEKI
jgi:hypothetical protein